MAKSRVLASLTMAQAILESGWGKSGLAVRGCALFGIKATSTWKGKVYNSKTQECYDGKTYVTVDACFRAYNSWEESIADHSAFLTGMARYAAVIGERDYKKACHAIKAAGYATAPDYADSLIRLIEQCGLTQHDTAQAEKGIKMNLNTLLLTNNECYKVGKKITVKGIMVHSTGANNPNLKRYVGPNDGKLGDNAYNNHWNQNRPDGRQVCVHAFIGKLANGSVATYQTLPWDMRGWHGGSGSKGCVNDTHIGFEMCEDGLTDPVYFNAVYNEAVELCAYLCKMFNLDPLKDGVIIGHYEGASRGIATNHGDPNNWLPKHGKSMDAFRAAVKSAMGGTTPMPTPTTANTTPVAAPYTVRVTADTLNIRKGPGTNYGVTGAIKDKGVYTIVEEASGTGAKRWGKLKSGAGWISLDYTQKR